mmetsp:Transcript_12206/g.17028  ORF Transcript_12206/g.17028 Transcript_12206/m.17028 type:complete len:442 (-) Transcript_12206:372-1697(-)
MICHNRSLATTAAARLMSVHQSLEVGGSCRQIVNIPTRSTSTTAATLSLSPIVRKNPFCLRRRHHNLIFRNYLSQNLHPSCSFMGGTTKIFLRNNNVKIKRYFATLGSPKNNINNNNNIKLSRRQRRKQERYQQKQERKNKNKLASSNNSRNNNSNDALSSSSSTTTTTTNRFPNIITSLRNLGTLESFTKTKLWEALKRFPFFVALVILASWDETSPFVFEQTLGPSMLPTIHPMGDLYVRQTNWFHRLTSSYQVGDIVIFQKEASDNYYSCKRIIGLEGQQVLLYGQYVHLFQDRTDKGIIPLDQTNIEQQQQQEEEGQQLPFALKISNNNNGASSSTDVATNEGIRCTFTIPPGHVWVEGDNPLDSLDSRHYGPIPLSALRGRLVMRLWPLWRSKQQSQSTFDQNQDKIWMSRNRPIPLSRQYLLNGNYNLHPRPTPV